MAGERLRQQQVKDVEEKEQELEEQRAASGKKIKSLTEQLEEEYAQRQQACKDKRELERRLQELSEEAPRRNRGNAWGEGNSKYVEYS